MNAPRALALASGETVPVSDGRKRTPPAPGGADSTAATMNTEDADTLVMTYQSERGLIDLAVSMTKAIGTYFREEIKVTKLSTTRLEIVFSR